MACYYFSPSRPKKSFNRSTKLWTCDVSAIAFGGCGSHWSSVVRGFGRKFSPGRFVAWSSSAHGSALLLLFFRGGGRLVIARRVVSGVRLVPVGGVGGPGCCRSGSWCGRIRSRRLRGNIIFRGANIVSVDLSSRYGACLRNSRLSVRISWCSVRVPIVGSFVPGRVLWCTVRPENTIPCIRSDRRVIVIQTIFKLVNDDRGHR